VSRSDVHYIYALMMGKQELGKFSTLKAACEAKDKSQHTNTRITQRRVTPKRRKKNVNS
jgi:hypothetical protein